MDIRDYVNKNEVLEKVGKNTFRFLHETDGFNFEKPFICSWIAGSVTIKKLWDLIPHIKHDYKIIVIIHETKYQGDYYGRYKAVKIYANDFDVDVKSATYFNYKTIPDTYFRKSDFTEQRKKETSELYLIAQREEYTMQPTEKTPWKVSTLDNNERYKIADCCFAHTNSPTTEENRYISRIELKETTNNGKKVTFEPQTHYENGKRILFKDVYSIIDHSGYYLLNRQDELKRKAAKLRAEREKAAYNATDTSGRVAEAKKAVSEFKQQIADKILHTSTYEGLKELARIFDKFAWTIFDVELFEQRTTEKEYSSIAASEKAYNNIIKKLNNMKEGF